MKHGERLASLTQGEVLPGSPLMKGMTPDKLEAHVIKVSPAGVVTMDIMFMGVKLATAAGKSNGDKIAWWEGK